MTDRTKPAGDSDDRAVIATGRADRRGFGPGSTFGMPVERTHAFGATLRRLGATLRSERVRLIAVVALTVGAVVLAVLGPWILGKATDEIIAGIGGDLDRSALERTLLSAVAVYVGAWVLAYGQSWLLAGVVQRTMFTLRESVEAKVNRLPLSYVDRQSRGDLLSRVTNDIDNFAQSLQQTASQLINSLLTLVGVTIMMFVISPLLAVVAMITVPISILAIKLISARARPKFFSQWRYTGRVNGQAEEVFTGHAIVKSFGRQRQVQAQFAEDNEALYGAAYGAQAITALIQPITMFLGNVQFVLVAVVGGVRVANGAVSIGEVQAMIQYSRQFSQPMGMLATMVGTFQSGIASFERVVELLDAPDQLPDPAPATTHEVQGRIVFDDVHFSYSPDRPLIEGLSLVAEPGQTIAIVGPTGAGKTTIVNLLMRFYELDGGRITLDGTDIATISRAELRSEIGMVLQDTWLFGGTIRDNLAYGNPSATDEQILEAARVTYVDRFVRTLPDGYDTVINDEGDNISAGEKQLITIARAFLADPAILILDEATSSVDTRTEVLIQEAMNALRRDRTSFVIAHRLSTIRGADVILVMDQGRIVETGNHDELLAANGAYARLYNAQFAGQST